MFRAYKYLLRPTPEQAGSLDFLLWQSRNVYNAALEQRIKTYKETGKGATFFEQAAQVKTLRKDNPDTIGKVNFHCLVQTLRKLDKAFQAFFRRVKAGETPGFPRFKSRNRFHSMEYTYGNGCKLHSNEHGRFSFYVMNVGEMRMCYHRAIPENAVIKQAVIKRSAGRWYTCLMIELPDPQPEPREFKPVGVDVGIHHLLATSDNGIAENPRWLKNSLAKLRILQRHAARQVKGSNRQKETYRQVARLHEHIANQRRDYLHKISRGLVNGYSFIAIEDLTLAFMNQNKHLALASHDVALGELRTMLQYKAESAGTEVVAVNPRNTSQLCSECGKLVQKDLSARIHQCPSCGLTLDRDVNAARNILLLAINPPGRGGQALTRPIGASVA